MKSKHQNWFVPMNSSVHLSFLSRSWNFTKNGPAKNGIFGVFAEEKWCVPMKSSVHFKIHLEEFQIFTTNSFLQYP